MQDLESHAREFVRCSKQGKVMNRFKQVTKSGFKLETSSAAMLRGWLSRINVVRPVKRWWQPKVTWFRVSSGDAKGRPKGYLGGLAMGK